MKKPTICKCDICGSTYNSAGALTQHYLALHPVRNRKFNCDTCGKKFVHKHDVTRHEKTHHPTAESTDIHKSKQFVCKIVKPDDTECGQSFGYKTHLTRHVRIHHSEDKEVHQCEICEKVFSRDDALRRHIRTHASKELICPDCGKEFSRLDHLKKHMHRKINVTLIEQIDYNLARKIFLLTR